jgi:EAL and modified HD-GYP domain-containing signal transduction protein
MECFTARQPIFDRQRRVRAYELLHRESEENCFPKNVSSIQATSKVLVNTFLNMNIDRISEGKDVLVNFSEKALIENFPEVAPYNRIILEILETVTPNQEMYDIIRSLFHKRYRIALDDFEYSADWERFLKFIKVVKFDIQQKPLREIKDVIAHFKKNHPKIKLLAEKVETYKEYEEAREMGFHYFQGYFFAKPVIIKSQGVDISESSLMNIYVEVMKPNICFKKLNTLLQCDLSLCYKLLNYVNSPTFGIRMEISSIKQALSFLGENQLRRFICLLVTSELSQDKPPELLRTSIYRARFAELLVKETPFKNYSDRAFLAGLFSTIDAVLDISMERIMEELPLDRDIKLALAQNVGLLAGVLNIIKSYEKGNWHEVDLLCKNIELSNHIIRQHYFNALVWEKQQIQALSEEKKSESAA